MLHVQLVYGHYIYTCEIACSAKWGAACYNEQALSLFVPASPHLAPASADLPAVLRPFNVIVDTDVRKCRYDVMGSIEGFEFVLKDDRDCTVKRVSPSGYEVFSDTCRHR